MEGSTYDQLLRIAGKILSSRPHSRGELKQKLQKLAEEDTVRRVLDRLQELGLLNDENFAYNLACRRLARDGWLPDKVCQFLARRHVEAGLARVTVDRALAAIGEREVVRRLLERRLRSAEAAEDPRRVSRLYRSLLAGGFTVEIVRDVLKPRVPPAIWQEMEDGE